MSEIWKDIKGFEGKFQVSNTGIVKRLLYITKTGKIIEEKIIKPFTWQSRYLRVDISYAEDGIKYRRATYIHNLVAETFLGERPEGYVIDHISGNYLDNSVNNLRYVTIKENMNNPNNKQGMKGRKFTKEERAYISKRTREEMKRPDVLEKLRKKKRDRNGRFIKI